MAFGEATGEHVRHDGNTSVTRRPGGPPPVPDAGDVPVSALRSLAAVVNRPTGRSSWTVTATGREVPGSMGTRPRRTATWREVVHRTGSRRIEVLIDGAPVVAFTPLVHRVTTGLVMPGIERIVDVSVQPGSAVRTLERFTDDGTSARSRGAADRSRDGANDARDDFWSTIDRVTREAVEIAVDHSDGWRPSTTVPLTGVLGGCAFPLLGSAYDLGAEPVGTVPRWAERILSASTIGLGARIAFDTSATRPVRRALVEALRPGADGQVDLAVLALALIGRHVLQPDRIARLLAAPRVPHPVADLPDPHTLETAATVVGDWGDRRCERILIDAVGQPDGLRILLTTVGYAVQLGADGPRGRLPGRLADLHDVYRVLMRSAPDRTDDTIRSTTGRSDVPTGSTTGATVAARSEPVDPPAFPHPVLPTRRGGGHGHTAGPVPHLAPGNRIEHRPEIRSLDGLQVGDLRFVLPHTVADLTRWGRLLSNCLGGFSAEALSGCSSIIGVERSRRLAYAIEVTRQGGIRQFNGRANRIPKVQDRNPIITTLLETRAIDPHHESNRAWIAAVGGP